MLKVAVFRFLLTSIRCRRNGGRLDPVPFKGLTLITLGLWFLSPLPSLFLATLSLRLAFVLALSFATLVVRVQIRGTRLGPFIPLVGVLTTLARTRLVVCWGTFTLARLVRSRAVTRGSFRMPVGGILGRKFQPMRYLVPISELNRFLGPRTFDSRYGSSRTGLVEQAGSQRRCLAVTSTVPSRSRPFRLDRPSLVIQLATVWR